MERLTQRNQHGVAEHVTVGAPMGKDIMGKLAAYEDIGLSPDEALELAQAKQEGRMVQRGADTDIISMLILLLDYIRTYEKYKTLWGITFRNAGTTWNMKDARELLIRLLARGEDGEAMEGER